MRISIYGAIILTIGSGLVILAAALREKCKAFFDVLRDIGIALVVAVVVTAVFELYARTQETVEAATAIYDINMSTALTGRVWNEVKTQLLNKHLLRQKAEMRIRVERSPQLLPDQILINVEFTYDLVNVSDPSADIDASKGITLRHNLAYNAIPQMNIPRFEFLVIDESPDSADNKTLSSGELKNATQAGYQEFTVHLKKGQQAHVRTGRVELANVPGSWTNFMNEYTEGLRVYLAGDSTIDAVVTVRPRPPSDPLSKTGNSLTLPFVILPGQAVQMRFFNKP